MWVRLLKSYVKENGKRLPVGKVVQFLNPKAEGLIRSGHAIEYTGPMPPKKMKTDFFKPKNNETKWQQLEQ